MSALAENHVDEAEQVDVDPRSLPLLHTELRNLRVVLTAEQAAAEARRSVALREEITERTADLAQHNKDEKKAIVGLEEQREAILDALARGRTVEVEVEVRLDDANARRVVLRAGTDEVITYEPLQKRDRQPQLPLATLEDGQAPEPAADEPVVPKSREHRSVAILTLEGPGGAVVQRLHDEGYFDTFPDADRYEEWSTRSDEALEAALDTAMQDLDAAEAGFAEFLNSNEDERLSLIASLDTHQSIPATSDGSNEVDEWIYAIRTDRSRIDTAETLLEERRHAATGEAVEYADRGEYAGASVEPLPEGVRSITLELGQDDVAFHVVLVTDDVLGAALSEIVTALGGTVEPPLEALRGEEATETDRVWTIESPVAPIALIVALRHPDDVQDAVNGVLVREELLAELALFIQHTADSEEDLVEQLETQGPSIHRDVEAYMGPRFTLPVDIAAKHAWLVAAEQALLAMRVANAEPVTDSADTADVVERFGGGTDRVEDGAQSTPPPSRAARAGSIGLVGSSAEQQTVIDAHHAGMLDPTAEDYNLGCAAVKLHADFDTFEASVHDELDALEQDLVRDLESSAPGRMALSRGTYPTGVAKVDAGIAEIRSWRARLDAIQETIDDGNGVEVHHDQGPDVVEEANSAPTAKIKLTVAQQSALAHLERGGDLRREYSSKGKLRVWLEPGGSSVAQATFDKFAGEGWIERDDLASKVASTEANPVDVYTLTDAGRDVLANSRI